MASQLTKRVLSALCLIPVVVGVLWAGGIALTALMAVMLVISLKEWVYISTWQGRRQYGLIAVGFVYVVAAFFCLYETGMNEPKLWLPLYLLLAVWLSDSGAYLAGKTIGGPKMAPSISPNKTWAGMFGACFFPALGIAIYHAALNAWLMTPEQGQGQGLEQGGLVMPDLSMIGLYVVIGLVTGFAGQAGDLSVSWIKRKAGVKDTGVLIPGHGGILDRIDALMVLSILFWVWMQCGGYQILFPNQVSQWISPWSNAFQF